MKIRLTRPGWRFVLIFLLLASLMVGGYWYKFKYLNSQMATSQEAVSYSSVAEVAFIEEAYGLINQHYWQAMSDEQLSDLFFQSLSRVYGSQPQLKEKNRAGLAKLVESLVGNQPDKDHPQLIAQTLDLVLQNLQPFGRSRLYSQGDETALQNTVDNVDPTTNLFETLGTIDTATAGAITTAYQQKKEQIEQTVADENEKTQQLAQVERAYQAVGDEVSRERYAQTKVEPTILGKSLSPQVYYIKIGKFSPTTVEDLASILKKIPADNQTQALVLDLQANVGGAIDGLPYFLGPFIGKGQYAYQFFSRGETSDFKTVTDRIEQIANFKQVVVLIDAQTQSSAEVMAATLKKYGVGVLVGWTTKGWGTVERVFPLEKQISQAIKYSVFLVHSLTLDENGQPIEGAGVAPNVDVTKPGWQTELLGYFNNLQLVDAVKQLVNDK
ncbi:MAG: S41 family peptidase [Patescibacteria group bacterium]